MIKLVFVCLMFFMLVGSVVAEAPQNQFGAESSGDGSVGSVTVTRKKPHKPHGNLMEALLIEN